MRKILIWVLIMLMVIATASATQLILNETDTQLLNDADSYNGNVTEMAVATVGLDSLVHIWPTAVMTNIEEIPENKTVTNAMLYFYITSLDYSGGYGCYEYNNHTWDEHVDNNDEANIGSVIDTFNPSTVGQKTCNITDWVSSEYNNDDNNFSIAFKSISGTTNDAEMASKEHENSTYHWYVVIDYENASSPASAPNVTIDFVYPTNNISVLKGELFNVTLNISCSGDDCNGINVSLTPQSYFYEQLLVYEDNEAYAASGGDDNYGDRDYFRSGGIGWSFTMRTYIVFNNTLPSDAILTQSDFVHTVTTGADILCGIYDVYVYPWVNILTGVSELNESTLIWNNQPCGTSINNITNTTNCNATFITEHQYTPGFDDYVVVYDMLSATDITEQYFNWVLWGTEVINNNPSIYSSESSIGVPFLNMTYARPLNGLITVHSGGEPFWTNTTNPNNISLANGESVLVTFWLNATGKSESTHEVNAFANMTSNESINDITPTYTITIVDHIRNISETGSGSVGYGYNMTINATIEDGDGVDATWITVTQPNSTVTNRTGVDLGNDKYQFNFTDTWAYGDYSYSIFYNDTTGAINGTSDEFSVNISATISIQTMEDSYDINDTVNLTDPPGMGGEGEELIEVLVEFTEKSIIQKFPKDEKLGKYGIMSESIVQTQESKITTQQDKVIDTLSNKPKYRLSKTMNAIITKVTKEEYNQLENNKDIKKIMELGEHRVHMSGSRTITGVETLWALQNASGAYINGTGIVVAVLDTGIDYTHTYFGNCTTENFTSGNCPRFVYGYDFYNDDNDPFDDNGHGTHVSGIVGGIDPDNTYTGNAPGVKFLEYKVCSASGGCPDGDIIAAIENATAMGADVIHMSFGSLTYIDYSTLGTALQSAYDAGTMSVASAGNDGSGYDTISCPSCLDFVISVGSTTKSNIISGFSSRGLARYSNGTFGTIKPDLLAPGSSITAPVPTGSCELCDGSGENALSGTSMSAPQISGILSLLIQAHPDWSMDELKSAMTLTSVDLGYDIRTQGSGRVDAVRAYNSSIGSAPYNYLAKRNDVVDYNYSDNFTINIIGLLRNESFNVSFVTDDYNITANITEFTSNTTKNISIFVNITRVNTEEAYGVKSQVMLMNSSTGSYRVPIDIFTSLNAIGCPSGATITEDLTMAYNLTCTYIDNPNGGLIVIGADDITIDCNHSTLHGKKEFGEFMNAFEYSDYAIFSNNYTNITIKNCHFEHFARPIGAGGKRVHIVNNTFENVTDYIRLFSQGAGGHIIEYNDFLANDLNGIYILHADHVIIRNNNINATLWAITTEGAASQMQVKNLSIYDNIFTHTGDYSSWPYYNYGVLLDGIDGVKYYNNTFTNGIYSLSVEYARNVEIYNNTFNTVINGMRFTPETFSYDYGVIKNITFDNNYVDANTTGLHCSDNIEFELTNSEFTNNAQTSISIDNNAHITFTNITFNRSTGSIVDSATLTRNWYSTVNVTNETNGAIPNVNVTSYKNVSGTWTNIDSQLTDSDGTAKVKIPQYYETASAITYYASNITGTKKFYYTNSTTYFNYTDNTDIDLVLQSGAPDLVDPIITVNSPSNNSISNITIVMLNISTDEECGIALYSANGAANITMNETDSQNFYYNATFSDETQYTIVFYANDTSGNIGSKTILFTVNTSYSPPSAAKSMINLSTGSNSFFGYLTQKVQKNNGSDWSDYATITNNEMISVTSIYALDIIWWNNGAWIANTTGNFRAISEVKSLYGNLLNADATSYLNATYAFNVTDTNAPSITINSPTTPTYTNSSTLLLNYTATDASDDTLTCWYTVDDNTTASPNNPVTSGTPDVFNMTGLNESSHSLTVTCQDSLPQNTTSSSVTFNVDLTAPVLYNEVPTNGTTIAATEYETFQVNINESVSLNESSCFLYYRVSTDPEYSEQLMSYSGATKQCSVNIDMSGIEEDETVYYYFTAKDQANNLGIYGSEGLTLFVIKQDSTIPVFSHDLANFTHDNSDTFTYDINATDNIEVDCFAVNNTDLFVINCSGYLNQTQTLPLGAYVLNITVNDTSNNIASDTMVVNVTDGTAPIISDITATVSGTSVTISIIANEQVNLTVSYSINASNLSNSASQVSKSTTPSKGLSSLSESTLYYYNTSCCDSVGNCVVNGTYNFTTGTTPVDDGDDGGGGGGGGGGTIITDDDDDEEPYESDEYIEEIVQDEEYDISKGDIEYLIEPIIINISLYNNTKKGQGSFIVKSLEESEDLLLELVKTNPKITIENQKNHTLKPDDSVKISFFVESNSSGNDKIYARFTKGTVVDTSSVDIYWDIIPRNDVRMLFAVGIALISMVLITLIILARGRR